jgi:hypothetical protein
VTPLIHPKTTIALYVGKIALFTAIIFFGPSTVPAVVQTAGAMRKSELTTSLNSPLCSCVSITLPSFIVNANQRVV